MTATTLPHRHFEDIKSQRNFEVIEEYLRELKASELGVATAYRKAAQTLKAATSEQIKLDTAIEDSEKLFNLSEGWYVAPTTGNYLVVGQVELTTRNLAVASLIKVSGVEVLRGSYVNAVATTGSVASTVAGVVHASAGQHIELFGFAGEEMALALLGTATNRLSVMPTSQRTGPEGKAGATGAAGKDGKVGYFNAEAVAGVDRTGKTDSTKGLEEALQKAVEERRTLYVPGGVYLIGESGTGWDFKTVNYKELEVVPLVGSPLTVQGLGVICSPAAIFKGNKALKENPIINVQPPSGKQFISSELIFGQIFGSAIVQYATTKAASKAMTGFLSTKGIEKGMVIAGRGLTGNKGVVANVVSETEVELEVAAAEGTTSPFAFGARESFGLQLNQINESEIFLSYVTGCKYGLYALSKETDATFTANNLITCITALGNEIGICLSSGKATVGVQGNTFRGGDAIGNGTGIVVDVLGTKHNSISNSYHWGVIEANYEGAVLDNNGESLWEVVTFQNTNELFDFKLPEGAASPYVRGSFLTGTPAYLAPGREGIDFVNFAEKIGPSTAPATPLSSGAPVRNTTGRPQSIAIALKPNTLKPTTGTAVGTKKINLSNAEITGWIKNKPVTFTKLPLGVIGFVTEAPYYINFSEFSLAKELKTTEKIFEVTGSKAAFFTNGQRIQFTELPAGVTSFKRGVPYFVVKEEANNFELAATVGGVGIELTGANLTVAETKLQRYLSAGFELAATPGGTPIEVKGEELTAAGSEFSTPSRRIQLTGNTAIGTTTFTMKEAKGRGFQGSTTFPKIARFVSVTPGVKAVAPGFAILRTYYLVGGEIEPTSETKVGETKINLKAEGNIRFPNNINVEFSKLTAGVEGLKEAVKYFVVESEAEGFKLSLTEGGAAIEVKGHALEPATTRMVRPNNFELSETENGAPIKVESHVLEYTSTELNPNLVTVEKQWTGIEGEGVFTIPLAVNAQISFGIYTSRATWNWFATA